MAEALGLVTNVIAVADVAVKAGSAYVKITRLWDEIKQRGAFWFKRRIASTKAVLNKDELEALTSKFDRALNLFQRGQDQQRHWIAIQTYCIISQAHSALPELISPSEASEEADLKATADSDVIRSKSKQSNWMRFSKMVPPHHLPSTIGSFHWESRATQGFVISFQPPSWLSQSVFSIMTHRSTMGWQVNLRTHEIVHDFSPDLRLAIQSNNPTNVYQHLDEHKMSPFVATSTESLLHTALRYKSLNVVKSLIGDGLDLNPRQYAAPLRCMNVVATRWSDFSRGSDGFEVIDVLGDVGLDYLLNQHDGLSWALSSGISFEGFRLMLERSRFGQEYSLSQKLEHLRYLVNWHKMKWTLEQVFFLLPEARNPDLNLLHYSRRDVHRDLLYSLAIGSVWVSCYYKMEDWSGLLSAWIQLDPPGLHYRERERWFAYQRRASTTFIAVLSHVLNNHVSLTGYGRDALELAQSAMQYWIQATANAGVDLLDYGRSERSLFERGEVHIRQRYVMMRNNRQRHVRKRYSIIGITYGALPEHWKIWFADDTDSLAGEFWNMIENKHREMPGAWVPDPMNTQELDLAWEKETASPLIWSEYRRIRAPA